MTPTVTAVLRRDKKNKNGLCPVCVRVFVKGRPSYTSVGVRVLPKEWDDKKRRVQKTHPNANAINLLIVKKLNEIEARSLQTPGLSSRQLTENARSNHDFYYYFEKGIIEARARAADSRAEVNQSILNVLKAWRATWPLNDVTADSLRHLERWLREKRKNSDATIADKMVRIQTVVNDNRKLFEADPFDGYKIKHAAADAGERIKPLDEDDLLKLRDVEIPERHKIMNRARKVWLFMFVAAGMRWGDACRLRERNVENGRIRYYTHKSRGKKLIDIPQSSEAAAIIEEFRRGRPDAFLFPMLRGCENWGSDKIEKRVKNQNRNYNRALGYVAGRAKMSATPRCHDARHLFADRVDDVFTAQLLLGHSKITTTQRYKKRLRGNALDEELLKAVK